MGETSVLSVLNDILSEFKRRNIFRVGSVYALTGWMIIRVSIAFESSLGLPDWFDALITALIIISFPIALIIAWAFELTPEGIKRTESVDVEDSIAPDTGRKLNYILAGALILAVGFISYDIFNPRAAKTPHSLIKTSVSDRSIAVMPFTDLSPEGDQEYFSDGISEELLNVLAQVPDLQVAGRTSSFAFKGKNQDLREIGEILDVAHILEGSVRKAGENIRVTAQLIKVADGYQMWSSNYDGNLSDIFKVQDEISQSILTELMPQLLGADEITAQSIKAPRASMDVYDLYLLSKQYARGGTYDDYKLAAEALDKALITDPNYVPALAWRGYYEIVLSDAPGFQGVTPLDIASGRALVWIEKAISLDPNSADALFARATLYSTDSNKTKQAEADYRRALEIKPNFPIAKNDYAVLLESEFKFEEAFELFKEALSHDPALVDANFNLFQGYFWLSRFDEAQGVLDNWARVSPEDETLKRLEANFAFDTGQMAKGMNLARALEDKTPDTPLLTRFLTLGLFELGENEAVLRSDYTDLNPFALLRLGRVEEAQALAESNIKARPNFTSNQQSYIDFLFMQGEFQKLSDYYDETYQTVETFSESDSYPPFEKVTAALLETKHPQAEDMMKATRAHIDIQRESRISLSVLDIEESVLLILEGKTAAALDRLDAAFSKGSYDLGISLNPVYARLNGDPRFEALKEKTLAAINRERRALNLMPIELPQHNTP